MATCRRDVVLDAVELVEPIITLKELPSVEVGTATTVWGIKIVFKDGNVENVEEARDVVEEVENY